MAMLDAWLWNFMTIDEGVCVQIIHMDPYDDEPTTAALWIKANGYENDFSKTRLHHETYLTDARKAALEKWKTGIRHPIKKAE